MGNAAASSARWDHIAPEVTQEYPIDGGVAAQVAVWQHRALVVHPQVAMWIAGSYAQDQGTPALAVFAESGTIERELLNEVAAERYFIDDPSEVRALDALFSYVRAALAHDAAITAEDDAANARDAAAGVDPAGCGMLGTRGHNRHSYTRTVIDPTGLRTTGVWYCGGS